ncbi:hypothetical protein, conserved [Leishmania tarentolae]|uniref:Uncharacterized protein n=1 Tax=Leishmania tarentolae TaxID=5689 RepID=A0A640KE81_LEITA|nr:hypothetical protein, conserved [Leishmania tarentolae]
MRALSSPGPTTYLSVLSPQPEAAFTYAASEPRCSPSSSSLLVLSESCIMVFCRGFPRGWLTSPFITFTRSFRAFLSSSRRSYESKPSPWSWPVLAWSSSSEGGGQYVELVTIANIASFAIGSKPEEECAKEADDTAPVDLLADAAGVPPLDAHASSWYMECTSTFCAGTSLVRGRRTVENCLDSSALFVTRTRCDFFFAFFRFSCACFGGIPPTAPCMCGSMFCKCRSAAVALV